MFHFKLGEKISIFRRLPQIYWVLSLTKNNQKTTLQKVNLLALINGFGLKYPKFHKRNSASLSPLICSSESQIGSLVDLRACPALVLVKTLSKFTKLLLSLHPVFLDMIDRKLFQNYSYIAKFSRLILILESPSLLNTPNTASCFCSTSHLS